MITYIPLDQRRDVSGMINTTFLITRQLIQPVLKASVGFVLPFLVLIPSVVVLFIVLSSFGAVNNGSSEITHMMDSLAASPYEMGLFIVAIVAVGTLVLLPPIFLLWNMMTIAILEYHRLKRVPQPEEIREACRGTRLIAFTTLIGTTVVSIVVNVVFTIPAMMVDNIFLSLLVNLVVVLADIVITAPMIMILVIRYQENLSFIEALKRSFTLTQGKWLSTVGFEIGMGLIISIFCLAIYIVVIVGTIVIGSVAVANESLAVVFGVIFGIVGMVVGAFAGYISLGLYTFSSAVLYFSRKERFESTGLLERIDMIGETARE